MSTTKRGFGHRRGGLSTWSAAAWPLDPDHLSPRLRQLFDLVPERALDYTWTKRPDWLPAAVAERLRMAG